MYKKRPILQGNSDQEQLTAIWRLCGVPTNATMPGWQDLPGCEGDPCIPPEHHNVPVVRRVFETFKESVHALSLLPSPRERLAEPLRLIRHTAEFASLIEGLLTLDPELRLTARDALAHEWFWSEPRAATLGQ